MILFIIWWFKVSGNALIFISTKLFSFCHLEIRHSILNSFSYNISVFVPIVNVSQNLTLYFFISMLQCKNKVMTKIYIVCPDCQCFAEFNMVLYFYTRASVQTQSYDFFLNFYTVVSVVC